MLQLAPGQEGWGSSLAAQFTAGATARPWSRFGRGHDGGLRGLSGLSGLSEVGERARLDRGLGDVRGDEARAELLAALGIIKATRGGQVGFGCFSLGGLATGFGERRLVLVVRSWTAASAITCVGSRPVRSFSSWRIRPAA